METNVQTDKKAKKAKKHDAGTVESAATDTGATNGSAEGGEGEAKATGAPRPRKWDYGITDEAQIVRKAEAPSVRKDIEVAWAVTEGNPTVAAFMAQFEDKSDARHCLRVMSRRELIKIVGTDGTEFPRPYVAPEPKAEAPATAEAAA